MPDPQQRFLDDVLGQLRVGGDVLDIPRQPGTVRADQLVEVSIGHAITADALMFGMAETVRLFRGACGDLRSEAA